MSVNPFLKKNKKERKPIKIYVSDLFVDENDNPVPIELRVISSKESDILTQQCLRPVIDPQTRKKVGEELDQQLFQTQMLVKSMVNPDLADKELQKSWGVDNEEDLLMEMFDSRERIALIQEFDQSFMSDGKVSQEAEVDAKNE